VLKAILLVGASEKRWVVQEGCLSHSLQSRLVGLLLNVGTGKPSLYVFLYLMFLKKS